MVYEVMSKKILNTLNYIFRKSNNAIKQLQHEIKSILSNQKLLTAKLHPNQMLSQITPKKKFYRDRPIFIFIRQAYTKKERRPTEK